MAAIEISGLTKQYATVQAVRGLDLTVPEGSLFGLIGPNGAGKSTLIKALVGALRPSSGTVRVLGLDPLTQRSDLRRQIGYMPQSPALYPDLSARDNVAFFGCAHGVPDLARRVDEVLTLADLAGRADDAVGGFSGGMQRRVSLACALVHRPRVLFLDEPTAAVDPALRARFWNTFRGLAASGVTLFISTHLMDEAALCDRVAILRAGRVIAGAAPAELLEQGRTHLAVCRAGREEQQVIGGRPEDMAIALRRYGLESRVSALRVERDSLETIVLSLIERQEAEEV